MDREQWTILFEKMLQRYLGVVFCLSFIFCLFQLSKSKTINFIKTLKNYFKSSFNKFLTGRVGYREERSKWIFATSSKLFALSVHPLVCLSHLSFLLSARPLACLPSCLFVCFCLSIHLSVRPSVCKSVSSVLFCVCPSICPSLLLFVFLSHLSFLVSVHPMPVPPSCLFFVHISFFLPVSVCLFHLSLLLPFSFYFSVHLLCLFLLITLSFL